MRLNGHVLGSCLILSVVLSLSSCYSYKPYLESVHTGRVPLNDKMEIGGKYKLSLVNGDVAVLKVRFVSVDSVRGRVALSRNQTVYYDKNYAISRDQIATIKERKFNPVKTTLLVVPVVLLILVVSSGGVGNPFSGGI